MWSLQNPVEEILLNVTLFVNLSRSEAPRMFLLFPTESPLRSKGQEDSSHSHVECPLRISKTFFEGFHYPNCADKET